MVAHFRHGALPLGDGTTRFALWAPDAERVELLLGEQVLPMSAAADGWYQLLTAANAGERYRYRIDGHQAVPDPASRLQPEGVHGPSELVDHLYSWRHQNWTGRPWHEAVIMEVHVGLCGGFAGLAQELPRLADLGITAIELMPLNTCPGERNWGYDGAAIFAPQHGYGTPNELKALIDTAHGLGLMVLLDVVYNHFGPDGNYLGVYARSFFREDRHTPWGAAIDFRKPEVRDFFIDNALMWLNDYRFDGLRLDAVHAIDDAEFLIEMARQLHAETAGRQIWLTLENEHNQASLLKDDGPYDAQWNDDGHNTLHVLLTGEHEAYYADYARQPTKKLARLLGEGFVYQGQPNGKGVPRGEPSDASPASAFVLFLQNHDQVGNRALGERLIHLTAPQALRAAVAAQLLCPMIPLLFMGEEVGSESPFLFFTDHHGELADAVREGRRNEFAAFEAFNDPERREHIPDPNDPATFEASRPLPGPDAKVWNALYRELLALRRQHLTPRLRHARPIGAEVLAEGAVMARWRMGDRTVLSLFLNLSAAPVACALPSHGQTLYRQPPSPSLSGLAPYEILVHLGPVEESRDD